MMKKMISGALSLVLVTSLSVLPVHAADYSVEGESYTETNWRYVGGTMLSNNSGASGGKYISLNMDTESDMDFYAAYTVNASTAGYYKLTLYSTPVTRTGWASPMYVNVNDGADVLLDGTKGAAEAVSGTGIYANTSDVLYLNKGNNRIKFIVKDKNEGGKYVASIDKFTFTSASYEIDGVYSDNPYMVFESGSDVRIYVKGNGITYSNISMKYSVTKYDGTAVMSDKSISIPAGNKIGSVSLGSTLDKGSYKISVTYSGKTVTNYFSVVAPGNAVYEDSPFALDTNMIALYNKYSDNKDYVDNYAKALSLMNVSWIRDRISMDSVVSKNGDLITANPTANNYIGKTIKKYSDIKISAVINDLPAWLIGENKKLDCDLVDVYKAFKALGDSLGDSVDAIEILNEIDVGSIVSSADTPNLYASFFKAAAAGINDSLSNAAVISQGSTGIRALDYVDMLYKNDLFELSVADNYHFHYDSPASPSAYVPFPGIDPLKEIKALQSENGANKPVWVTEAGLLIECDEDTELNYAQQYAQAKYAVTSAVESIASGADKNFYFLGTVYQENGYTTGIMTKNDKYPSFYPAFAAMSAMTDKLGKGEYLGNKNQGNIRAYIFNNGTKRVMVAYSTGGTNSLSLSGTYTKYDMFGNELSGTSGSVRLTEEPIFIELNNDLSGVDTSGAHSIEKVIPIKATTGDHIVVSQDYSDDASVGARNGSYFIDPSANNTVTVKVSNLNDKEISGVLMPESNAGWTFEPASTEISLDAFETGTYTFDIGDYTDIPEAVVSFKVVCNDIESSLSAAKVKSGSKEYMTASQRYWIDATHYSLKQGAYEEKLYPQAVNGRVMRLYTNGYPEPNVRSSLTYDFELPSAGTYNVWMLVSSSRATSLTKWKWRYELPDEYKRYTGSNPSVTYDAGSQHMYWYKVDSNKSLSAGKHSIVILSDALREQGGYMLQIIDSIVIVPTSDTWWSPVSKTNGENVIAFESRNFASNFNLTNLTEDVTLPLKTATGASIRWTTSDSNVIDSTGKIKRSASQGSATLTAVLTYDSSSTTVNIPVTVAAATNVLPKVTLVDNNDNVITEINKNHDNYVKITITNPLSEEKNAILYVAGYDNATNRLLYCNKYDITVPAGRTITPENILIDDVQDESIYKVFTWTSDCEPLMDGTTAMTSVVRDDACVTISGNCGKANEKLTMTVVKADSASLTSMSKEDVKKNLCYISGTTADSDGKYTFRFKLNDSNGKYKVNIQTSSGRTQSFFMVE